MNTKNKRTILFIINPASGSNQKRNLTKEISIYCAKHLINEVLLETKGKNDKEQIIAAIDKYLPETVVAVGGDGTINLVASLLINKDIKLGIIPTGSANGMAFELNIPVNLEQAIAIIARNKSKRIDLLMINKTHVAVHLSDVGVNARIIKRFDKEKVRGLYGYTRQFFKELKSPVNFRCFINCKGKRLRKFRAVMVVMLNTHYYGTGAMVNPTGQIDDGKFEIVIIKPYPWYYIFNMFIAFFTGNIHRLRHVRVLSCKQARIQVHPAQDLQVDGEPSGMEKYFEIDVLPSAVEVIYNDQQDQYIFRRTSKINSLQ